MWLLYARNISKFGMVVTLQLHSLVTLHISHPPARAGCPHADSVVVSVMGIIFYCTNTFLLFLIVLMVTIRYLIRKKESMIVTSWSRECYKAESRWENVLGIIISVCLLPIDMIFKLTHSILNHTYIYILELKQTKKKRSCTSSRTVLSINVPGVVTNQWWRFRLTVGLVSEILGYRWVQKKSPTWQEES